MLETLGGRNSHHSYWKQVRLGKSAVLNIMKDRTSFFSVVFPLFLYLRIADTTLRDKHHYKVKV